MPNDRPLRPIASESLENLRRWYPTDRAESDPPTDDTFEIALVIAGAQSAGSYSAGVLDFLFEALDAWYAARQSNPDLPNHKVKIKVVVGASAGGLNAGLAAVASGHRFDPADDHSYDDMSENGSSPFYRAWVLDIDFSHLLETGDIAEDRPPISVLNSAYLNRKVDDYLNFAGDEAAEAATRAWLDDPLPIKIMVSNLNGVPYRVHFSSAATASGAPISHRMALHEDYMAFQRPLFADAPEPAMPDHELLPSSNSRDSSPWRVLGQAALATIAFPILLAEQRIRRPNTDYDYRFAFFEEPDAPIYAAGFPDSPREPVSFAAVDGGVMNNEPFGLAHDVLAGTAGMNPRSGKEAKRAVILIDPFVDPSEDQPTAGGWSVIGVATRIFGAFRSQSQFKQIDLALARSDDVYSRFLIAPVRRTDNAKIFGDRALASRPFIALAGYFDIHYRHHDFMLGRENCHRFLRDWFVLPSDADSGSGDSGSGDSGGGDSGSGDSGSGDSGGGEGAEGNNLFETWPQAALANPAFQSQSEFRAGHRQIIPLVGSAAQAPQAADWPRRKFGGYRDVQAGVEARLSHLYPWFRDAIATLSAKSSLARFVVRRVIDAAWLLRGRRLILNYIAAQVDGARDSIDRG